MTKKIGQIINDKADKTVKVAISELRTHKLYKKQYTVTSKILAHDEKNEFKTGEIVEITPVRPISRKKAWKVQSKIK